MLKKLYLETTLNWNKCQTNKFCHMSLYFTGLLPASCKMSTNKKSEDMQKPWVIQIEFHVLRATEQVVFSSSESSTGGNYGF